MGDAVIIDNLVRLLEHDFLTALCIFPNASNRTEYGCENRTPIRHSNPGHHCTFATEEEDHNVRVRDTSNNHS